MSMYQRVKIEDRLKFLRKLLTQPGVDEKLDHFHRHQLIEESQELEVALTTSVREELECEFS